VVRSDLDCVHTGPSECMVSKGRNGHQAYLAARVGVDEGQTSSAAADLLRCLGACMPLRHACYRRRMSTAKPCMLSLSRSLAPSLGSPATDAKHVLSKLSRGRSCRKKIRIAFYMQPPFIIVDPKMCKADPIDATAALLCPPEAFGDKLSTEKLLETKLNIGMVSGALRERVTL
jgi:hypothetical protein